MLTERGVEFELREYTRDPLSLDELREVFARLAESPRELLRPREAAQAGLTGDEPDEDLLARMAEQPTLLQRPIGLKGERAIFGRPLENLLEL